jgi:hypothetical protein
MQIAPSFTKFLDHQKMVISTTQYQKIGEIGYLLMVLIDEIGSHQCRNEIYFKYKIIFSMDPK